MTWNHAKWIAAISLAMFANNLVAFVVFEWLISLAFGIVPAEDALLRYVWPLLVIAHVALWRELVMPLFGQYEAAVSSHHRSRFYYLLAG